MANSLQVDANPFIHLGNWDVVEMEGRAIYSGVFAVGDRDYVYDGWPDPETGKTRRVTQLVPYKTLCRAEDRAGLVGAWWNIMHPDVKDRSFEDLLQADETQGFAIKATPNDEEKGIEGLLVSVRPSRTKKLLLDYGQISLAYQPELRWESKDRAIQVARKYLPDVSSVDVARSGPAAAIRQLDSVGKSTAPYLATSAVLIDVLDPNRPKHYPMGGSSVENESKMSAADMKAVNALADGYMGMLDMYRDMYRDMTGKDMECGAKDVECGGRTVKMVDAADMKRAYDAMRDMLKDMRGKLDGAATDMQTMEALKSELGELKSKMQGLDKAHEEEKAAAAMKVEDLQRALDRYESGEHIKEAKAAFDSYGAWLSTDFDPTKTKTEILRDAVSAAIDGRDAEQVKALGATDLENKDADGLTHILNLFDAFGIKSATASDRPSLDQLAGTSTVTSVARDALDAAFADADAAFNAAIK